MSFRDGFMFELGRASTSVLIALFIIAVLLAILGVALLASWAVQRWRTWRRPKPCVSCWHRPREAGPCPEHRKATP